MAHHARKPWHNRDNKRTLTGRPWRRLREQVLMRDLYTCRSCKRVSEKLEVDHVIPLSKGGDDSMGNLQSLCPECHERKTLIESGMKPKIEIGVDGWPR